MYIGIELTVICIAEIFLLATHYAARRRGLGSYFFENEGLTALATIMSPTFVGSEIPLAIASPIPDLSMIDFNMPTHHSLRVPANLKQPRLIRHIW